ncbi:UNVERIFIED_CONTAM: hypothetical protein NCL1_27146 [Trichonephila clavipes]
MIETHEVRRSRGNCDILKISAGRFTDPAFDYLGFIKHLFKLHPLRVKPLVKPVQDSRQP